MQTQTVAEKIPVVKQELPGESVAAAFPAHVELLTFYGVEVACIQGTEEEIRETTRLYDALYPEGERQVFSDATYLWYEKGPSGEARKIFELIVLRRVGL